MGGGLSELREIIRNPLKFLFKSNIDKIFLVQDNTLRTNFIFKIKIAYNVAENYDLFKNNRPYAKVIQCVLN